MYSFAGGDPAKDRQRRFWATVGDAWKNEPDPIEKWMQPITEAMNRQLGDRPQLALDLGCGARSMELPARWRALGVDPVAEILVQGKSLQGSSQSLPFQDASFDAVVSRMSVMLDSNPSQVFNEVNRALRMGGKFVFSVWDREELNMGTTAIEQILRRELGIRRPGPTEPSAFRLADTDEVTQLLREAKFSGHTYERVQVPYLASITPEESFEFIMKYIGPIRMMFDKCPDESKEPMREEIVGALSSVNRVGNAWVHRVEKEVKLS